MATNSKTDMGLGSIVNLLGVTNVDISSNQNYGEGDLESGEYNYLSLIITVGSLILIVVFGCVCWNRFEKCIPGRGVTTSPSITPKRADAMDYV